MIKKPSKYQIEIFDKYRNTNSNIVINACAGGGKTSTILELLNQTPKYLKTILLAFNKSIAEDIRKKVTPNIEVKTIHSLGCGLLYKHYPYSLKVSEYKNYVIAKKTMKFSHIKKDKEGIYIFNLSRMLDAYKLNLLNGKEQFIDYIENSNIPTLNGKDIEDGWELFNHVEDYNNQIHEKEFMIDFMDMLYLPIKEKVTFPKYNVVFIDETQDISLLQKKLVDNIIKDNGRFVAVGDEKQSIYQFIGANLNSFNEFKNSKNTLNLPLSVSYRCPKKVIDYANTIFPGVESFEGNKDGEVIMKGNLIDANDGDFVLCRNNLPLVEAFIYFLTKKKKSVIYGKDLGKTLQLICSRFLNLSKSELVKSFNEYLSKIEEQLKEKGINNPKKNIKYVTAEENILILQILINRFGDINNVSDNLDKMFSDDLSKGIILSTIHKAKGLEADNVFLYKFFELIPSKYAVTKQELYAEQCLKYVAVTRSKNKLIFVD